MLKPPNLLQRSRTRVESPKNHKYDFFLILVKFRPKMPILQKCNLFKITFCPITWAVMKLQTWNLGNIWRKKLQKVLRKQNFWFFDFFKLYWDFNYFLVKDNKNSIKLKKIEKSKFHFLKTFLYFFLHMFLKFHVCGFILAQVIRQKVIFEQVAFL